MLDLEYDAGVRSYEETEQEVSALLRSHSELPRGHFLRYLNSTQHKEFTGALDAVHRYFDYAIQRSGPLVEYRSMQTTKCVRPWVCTQG